MYKTKKSLDHYHLYFIMIKKYKEIGMKKFQKLVVTGLTSKF